MMELGFSNDENTLSYYKSIQDRKTNRYKSLLGDNVSNELKKSFFDVIVITAFDEQQRLHYERTIKEKRDANLIPKFVEYFVIGNPNDERVGCGGSTLFTLAELKRLLTPERFATSKILMLHAGGYSKRLPNHSNCGKIFASLPLTLQPDGVALTMLEMKIIILVDFPVSMNPGVFLACSDDIELFESKSIELRSPGFTSLAHPGTLDVGTGHGIFILENNDKYTPNQFNSCVRYLHKPNKQKMQQENAILPGQQVLLDSCYFFDHPTSEIFIKYYNENSPIQCEIDAYSDFLQPLGSNSKPDYFENKSNVTTYKPILAVEREKLYNLLKNCHLSALPLNPSSFIHIGTCHEYIEHFTLNFPKIGAERIIYSYLNNNNNGKIHLAPDTCLIHCLVDVGQYNVAGSTVVEYCSFKNMNVSVGKRCILADLDLNNELSTEVIVPSNTFIQTLSVSSGKYVTIMFGVDDSLKATSNPLVFGQPVSELICKSKGLSEQEIWESPENRAAPSLWTAALYPECSTPTESFLTSYRLLLQQNSTFNYRNLPKSSKLYSLEKCLDQKDLQTQATHRINITKTIKNKK